MVTTPDLEPNQIFCCCSAALLLLLCAILLLSSLALGCRLSPAFGCSLGSGSCACALALSSFQKSTQYCCHRRAHERCVSLRAASLRAWGGRGVALAGEAAFDRAALMRNACWATARAVGALTSDAFRFEPLLFTPGVGARWPWRRKLARLR